MIFSIALGSRSNKPHLPHGAKSAFIMPLITPQEHSFRNLFLPSWQSPETYSIWICPCYAVSHKQIRFHKWKPSDLESDLWIVFSYSLWNSLSLTIIPGRISVNVYMNRCLFAVYTLRAHSWECESHHCAQWHQSRHVMGITLPLSWKQRENK